MLLHRQCSDMGSTVTRAVLRHGQCCYTDSVAAWAVPLHGQYCDMGSTVTKTVWIRGQCCYTASIATWAVPLHGLCCCTPAGYLQANAWVARHNAKDCLMHQTRQRHQPAFHNSPALRRVLSGEKLGTLVQCFSLIQRCPAVWNSSKQSALSRHTPG